MTAPLDYLCEILRWDPASPPAAGLPDPVDVTKRVRRSALGSINRAVERDFLSFRTGDLTLSLRNPDGFLDDLFALFGPRDRWQLHLQLDGRTLFRGIILGQGSVAFDRKKRTVEMTVYGPTRMLIDASAATVKRAVADMTVTTATSGQAQITLNSTAGLLTGDVLHVTDQSNSEDVTVKQVTSATVVALESALANTYASGSPVVLTTPYYRYKTVEFLVSRLFAAAGVAVSQIKMAGSLFRKLAPTPANLTGLDLTKAAYSSPCEKDGAAFVTLIDPALLNTGPGTYSQLSTDADWVKEGADLHAWVDWSRYYRQDEAGPAVVVRNPQNVKAGASQIGNDPHKSGFDYRPATKTCYYIWGTLTTPDKLSSRTTVDGTTWTAQVTVSNLGGEADDIQLDQGYGVEFNPQRNLVFCWWRRSDNAYRFRYYDVGGAAWVDCLQADDAGKGYFGAVYVPELDALLVLRGSAWNGPDFEVAAFRGAVRLWARPFPRCLVKNEQAGQQEGANYPTLSLRYVNGSLYCLAISDGALHLVRSDDEFRTFTMKAISPATTETYYFGGRVKGQYMIAGYQGSVPRSYLVAAPFYAGIVSYADFSNKSVAGALRALAVLTNSVFLVDDDLQGLFVSRDLLPREEVFDLTGLVKELREVLVWEQTSLYASVSGGGFTEGAGDGRFIGSAIEVTSDLLPNAAYAASLAEAYVDFYSPLRRQLAAVVRNPEVRIYRPLDRVVIDGTRYVVLEGDTEIGRNQVTMKLVQDVVAA